MKIEFTKNGNTYTLESIKDFAKDLDKRFETTQKPGQNQFVADFAILDMMADNITIKSFDDLVTRASGWHGIKELGEIGFNDDEYRHLIFDYYSGGSMFLVNHSVEWSDENETFNAINKTLTDIFDVTSDEWVLLVQWTEDKCLVEDYETQRKFSIETEAVECCPHCDCENVYPNWDVKTQGYVAKCKGCGEDILLCDECLHADDNPGQKCDWSEEKGCFRYPKNKPENLVDKSEAQPQDDKKYYVDIFCLEDTTDVVVESDWMTEGDARSWFQSTINFVQYGNYGVRLMHAIGDDDGYDIEVVENLY